MSLRTAMIQDAQQARPLLNEARDELIAFLDSRIGPHGGMANRAGQEDLYYTMFGQQGYAALDTTIPHDRLRPYLESFGEGSDLDFIHLCCLGRCWSMMDRTPFDQSWLKRLFERIESYRTPDGGYNSRRGSQQGTAYGAFLAAGLYQDWEQAPPDLDSLMEAILSLQSDDGGFSNLPRSDTGITTAVSAVVCFCCHFNLPVEEKWLQWIASRASYSGGFLAFKDAPMPDLLSTATALHALRRGGAALDEWRQPCLNYLNSLWDERGGFYAHAADGVVDTEYTFYGLLALGSLA